MRQGQGSQFLTCVARQELHRQGPPPRPAGEPRPPSIRRAAVAQACIRAGDEEGDAPQGSGEQCDEGSVSCTAPSARGSNTTPKWPPYLRVYRAPQVPTADMRRVPPGRSPPSPQRSGAQAAS